MDYLPLDYEKVEKKSSYINIPQLEAGNYRYRIISPAIAGWKEWEDSKPIRHRAKDYPSTLVDPKKQPQPFWAFVVWDYQECRVAIMEPTQQGIIKNLTLIASDPKFGDLDKYDITLTKISIGKSRFAYSVSGNPHSLLTPEIVEAQRNMNINLEALYDCKSPFDGGMAEPEKTAEEETPDFLEEKIEGVSTQEAEYLEKMLEQTPGMQESVYKYLKKNNLGESLTNLSADIYTDVLNRVSSAIEKKRVEEEEIERKKADLCPNSIFEKIAM